MEYNILLEEDKPWNLWYSLVKTKKTSDNYHSWLQYQKFGLRLRTFNKDRMEYDVVDEKLFLLAILKDFSI